MAGEVERLSGKLGLDTTDFKTAVGSANRELRVLESGFKASAAALGDWSKDATGLESRIKSLTSQIDIQKLKVDALRAEHQRLVEANGAGSRAAQDAEIKLNKETETLNKMSNELNTTNTSLTELKSGESEAGSAASEMGSDMNDSSNKLENFKSVANGTVTVLKGVVTGILAVGAAAVASVALIGGLVFSTASAAGGLEDMSAKTGISVERLQELDFISKQIGTSLDTITGAQAKLVRSMASSSDGTGEQAKAFDQLGIKVTDAQGHLRDTQAVFDETIDALGNIQNPAERDALAMSIFGKSAQELNPLIKTGSEELGKMATKAHELGAVMSDENVAAFDAFDDTLASLQAGLKGTIGTLLSAFLPAFQEVFDTVGVYLKLFSDLVKFSDGDFGKLAKGLTTLFTSIVTKIGQQAPAFLKAGLNIVKSILDAVISALPTLLSAGIEIISTLINFIVAALPTLLTAAVQIILTLVNALIENLPMLIDAALQAIITLANGLTAALPVLIPAIVEAIITIVNTLLENLPMLVDAALALILALANGLIAALPILIPAIPVIIEALVNALIESLPAIVAAAGKLIMALAKGLVDYSILVTIEVAKIVVKVIDAFNERKEKFTDIGKNFIEGLIGGLLGASGQLYDAVINIAQGVLDSITNALEINSPSKKGRAIGRNLIDSMSLGGNDALSDVMRSFTGITGRLAQSAAAGATQLGSGGSTSVQHDSFQFFQPVIIQGDTPSGSLGASLKGKRY